jgi:hypothetical protein
VLNLFVAIVSKCSLLDSNNFGRTEKPCQVSPYPPEESRALPHQADSNRHTLVAYVDIRTSDKLFDLVLRLLTE